MARRLKCVFPVLLWLILIGFPLPAAASEPMVRAVLFWSDGCPHCHKVLEEVLPPLQERYGPQFQLKLLQVDYPENWDLYQSAVERYNISSERFGVPALIIGKTVLVGSEEIPNRLAAEIDRWLATGGVDYPPLPGLLDAPAVDMCGAVICDNLAFSQTTVTLPPAPTPGPDPVANVLAGGVMIGMVLTLVYAFKATTRVGKADPSAVAPREGGLSYGRAPTTAIPSWQQGLVPLLALVGLGIAMYLTYTKLTYSAVICGPVGDCDAVQASPYAEFLGIPVALLGALTYTGILGLWLGSRLSTGRVADLARLGMFGLALIGTLFSLYLTFLEPVVIGAVCAWCLASAVTMTLTLGLTTRIVTYETLRVAPAG